MAICSLSGDPCFQLKNADFMYNVFNGLCQEVYQQVIARFEAERQALLEWVSMTC